MPKNAGKDRRHKPLKDFKGGRDGHAEYRRVGSNAQSQSKHSQRSESGVLQQHAETVAQVLEVVDHNGPRRSFVEDTYADRSPNVSLSTNFSLVPVCRNSPCQLSFPSQMLSRANAFRISDHQLNPR